LKIVLNNQELSEIVKAWAEQKFNQNEELTIANKKNGIEVTVDLTDEPALQNVQEAPVDIGCCGEAISYEEEAK